MQVSGEIVISTLVIVGTVSIAVGSLRTTVKTLSKDMETVKKRLFNGAFVRRSECHYCEPAKEVPDIEGD
jgi:hypothetical protein